MSHVDQGGGGVHGSPSGGNGGPKTGMSRLTIALIVIGVLWFGSCLVKAVGFAILGREQPPNVARPVWKAGDTVEVEVTLVPSDRQDLACASTEEIAGKHCAFEAPNKPWSKGGADDKAILTPYTTNDQVNLTAAGLWSEAALAPGKLPATRFVVKCTYRVEGTLKKLAVRWREGDQYYPNGDWYAGTVSNCKISR